MRVKVKLQLTFADRVPGETNPFEMELAPETMVGEALEFLSIPAAVSKVIMVNGRVATLQQELKPGDELTVFPPLEGG